MTSASAPVPIGRHFDFTNFSCGDSTLDRWLKDCAWDAEMREAKTFVMVADRRVIGYYSLAVGGVVLPPTDGGLLGPLSAMVIGRLAVDLAYQERGLGAALLHDALLRVLSVRRVMDVRLIIGLATKQRNFFTHYGFQVMPTLPQATFLSVDTLIEAAISRENGGGALPTMPEALQP